MADDFIHFSSQLQGREIMLKRNLQQEQYIYNQQVAAYQKSINDKLALEKMYQAQAAAAKIQGDVATQKKLQQEISRVKKARLQEESQLASQEQAIRARATQAAMIYEQNAYASMSAQKKRAYSKAIAEETRQTLAAKRAEYNQLQAIVTSKTATKKEKDAARAQQKTLSADIAKVEQTQKTARENAAKFTLAEHINTTKQGRQELRKERREASNEKIAAKKQDKIDKANEKKLALEAKWQEKNAKRAAEIREAEAKGDTARVKQLKAQEKRARKNFENSKAYQAAESDIKKAQSEATKLEWAEAAVNLKNSIADALDSVYDKVTDFESVDKMLDDLFSNQAKMISRLQGSTIDWRDTIDDVSDSIGMSGIVTKQSVVRKMEELVDSGVAYNLELRAFIAETSQQIAATFNAFDSNLLRIIRLQQADTTAARMGLETTLTKLFNTRFKDSSYMNSASDTVTAALLDSSALMDKNESLVYEYTVQKWLGSLYSVGASSDVVQKIAQGINYLGTGNVQALNNDAGLQTLLSMAAARAGGRSYSDLLLMGLTSEDTNKLLKAMVEYLAEIADTSTNAVTRSAYADLFGMTVTDLATFSSLKTEEIEQLSKSTTSYNELMNETSSELTALQKRMNMSTIVSNAIENVMTGVATNIGSNAATYTVWKGLRLLEQYIGEIKIPGITGMGTGIASGLDLLNLAQTAMTGLSLISELVTGIGNMLDGGVANMAHWDFEEYTERGSGLSVLNLGSTTETSMSAKLGVGSASTEDIESTSLQSGTDSAEEASKKGTTSEEIEAQKDQMQKLVDSICGDSTPTVLSLLQEIDDRLDPGRVFYTAIAGVLSSDQASRLTNLSTQVSVAAATAVNSIEGTSSKTSGATAATATSNSTTTSGGVSGVTGYDENWSDEAKARYNQYVAELTPDSLSEIISMAVEQALRNIGNMPVDVKSMPGGSY